MQQQIRHQWQDGLKGRKIVAVTPDDPGRDASKISDRSHKQLSAEQRSAIAGRLLELFEAEQDRRGLAKRSGISQRSLDRYRSGQVPELPGLIAIADACGASLDWLLTGRGERQSNWITSRHPTNDVQLGEDQAVAIGPLMPLPGGTRRQYVPIPRYNIQASAGSGALAEHAQIVEYFAFDIDFVRTRLRRDPKHLVLIEARGDSMEPTIRDGDILTVDVSPDQALQSSTLYVIRVEEALMVKRLDRRIDGSIIVHSDNPRYPPETVPRDLRDELHILGQVILVSAPPR